MNDIAMAAYINKLTVLELVTRLEDWAVTNVIGGRSQVYPERDVLVAALGKAVIREASVGKAEIDVVNGFPYTHIYINGLKSGDYDLIPKDTP